MVQSCIDPAEGLFFYSAQGSSEKGFLGHRKALHLAKWSDRIQQNMLAERQTTETRIVSLCTEMGLALTWNTTAGTPNITEVHAG